MPQRILIVEDEPSIAELIAINLTHSGFTVERALQADEAMRMMRVNKPDLLVLDWMMPGKSGVQFTKALNMEQHLGSCHVGRHVSRLSAYAVERRANCRLGVQIRR